MSLGPTVLRCMLWLVGLQLVGMVSKAAERRCTWRLYALKVLRAYGMNHEWLSHSAILSVYQAVIISELSAWWGFASPSDRQRIQAFIRRSERSRFTPPDLPLFADLCREADDNLFSSSLKSSHHVLHHLLSPPSQASQHYSLRSTRHHLQLSITLDLL